MNNKKKHILIVNQHGENRGDEAAMRAMIRSLDQKIGNVKFSVVVQFKDTNLTIPFKQDVEILHMVMPLLSAIGLLIYVMTKLIGLRPYFLLSENNKKIIKAYEEAALAISAPGGPYFGDIYYKHELVHWFYVWLAHQYKKPLFLYSPSAGPFNIKSLNIVRKYLFKKFDVLCVREKKSKENLDNLLGKNINVHLTADSALQEKIEPFKRTEYFSGEKHHLSKKYLVAVTGNQYKYPGDKDAAKKREGFTKTLLKCLCYINNLKDCHFIFLPQLYGRAHSDVEYHQLLGRSLPSDASWEVINPKLDSDMHRRIFGMADICIASRYHPQIFATSNGVPGIFICYEHKQFSYLESIGLKDFAFDIRFLDEKVMCLKLDYIINNQDTISYLMKKNIGALQDRAQLTTQFVIDLYNRLNSRHTAR